MSLLPSLGKLFSLIRVQNGCCRSVVKEISSYAFPLQFKASPILWGEPLKKKKKIDPAVIKAREERQKKKIMKEIKKIQKLDKQLKPIAEFELPSCFPQEAERRKRNVKVSEHLAEERIFLLKKWAIMKNKESLLNMKILNKLVKTQQNALNELRLESEELYQAAVQIDPNLIPFKFTGPTETPRKKNYPLPDGAYLDKSKKWL